MGRGAARAAVAALVAVLALAAAGPAAAAADLVVAAAGAPATPQGGTASQVVTVRNAGPDLAAGVTLAGALAGGGTLASATPSQGDCALAPDAATTRCALGALAPGASARVTVAIRAPVPGTVALRATATSDQADPTPADATATAVTAVDPLPDLRVTARFAPDPAFATQPLVLVLTVANEGLAPAGEVVLDVQQASAYTTFRPSQGSCAVRAVGGREGGPVVLCALGDIAPGAQAVVTLDVLPAAAGGGTASAEVFLGGPDADPADNRVDARVAVSAVADLAVTATAPAVALAGGRLEHVVTVTNRGPWTAAEVVLVEDHSDGVAVRSAVAGQGICDARPPGLVCALGAVPAGASVRVVVTSEPSIPGAAAVIAAVASVQPDGRLVDNGTVVVTSVGPAADVAVAAIRAPSTAPAGGTVAYRLLVTNHGPIPASDVLFADGLGSADGLVSARPGRGKCATGATVVTCALGTIPSGGSVAVDLLVRAPLPGTISHGANVRALQDDPDGANNQVDMATTLLPGAEVRVAASGPPSTIVGAATRYRLRVVNRGPSDARGLRLVHRVQPGAVVAAVRATRGRCARAGRSATCRIGALRHGDSVLVTVVVRATRVGTVRGQAVVTATPGDPVPANNRASATTAARPAVAAGRVLTTDAGAAR